MRKSIEFMLRFCKLDPYKIETISRYKSPARPSWSGRRGYNWQRIHAILQIYGTFRMFSSIILHYNYDTCLRLKRQLRFSQSADEQANGLSALGIDNCIDNYRFMLKLIGAPYLNFHFLVSVGMLIAFGLNLSAYYVMPLFFDKYPIDSRVLRFWLDEKRELNYIIWTIQQHLKQFAISSANFSACLKSYFTYENKEVNNYHQLGGRRSSLIGSNNSSRNELLERRRHKDLIEQLVVLEQSKILVGRSCSSDWILKVAGWYRIFWVVTGIASPIVLAFIMIGVPLLHETIELETDLMDILTLLDYAIYCSSALFCSGFYASFILLSVYYQVCLIRELKLVLNETVSENRLLFQSILINQDESQRKSSYYRSLNTIRLQVNMNFLRSLLLYKIFVCQLAPVRKGLSGISFITFSLVATFFIFTRIHAPYFEGGIIPIVLMVAVLIIICLDVILVPVCHLNSRCLDIPKHLFELLTSAIEIEAGNMGREEQSMNQSKYSSLLDQHTVCCLRKELSQVDHLKDKFSFRCYGLTFNYNVILISHFWFGLIALSLLYLDTSVRNEGRFETPFKF